MFKKSRRKIVAAIMSVLVLLWVGMLGVIYISSYIDVLKNNERMLRVHADMYMPPTEFGMPENKPAPPEDKHGFSDSPQFRLSTFYTVALTYGGDVIEIKNEQPTVHSDSELRALAEKIIAEGKANGKKNDLVYYASDKGGYMLVTFMDNTIINESATTLFRYTLIFGGAAMVLFFFLSIILTKKIVQPLEESYQKQKQFISDAGHELKTPVSVVGANAELLSRELGENQWLNNIMYENERMGALIAQLLELTRTERVSKKMQCVDFSRLCNGEALPFESVAFEKGLTLCSDIAPSVLVEGNADELKQLVAILLDNAVNHSEGGGTVALRLEKAHGSAGLSVINAGKEIPQEKRELIFERFYREDTARTGDGKHYGLGLAIARSIVSSHKGKIDVLCYDGLVEFRVQLPTA